ncbi:haloacid dehalogenase-like hydrolase [Myxococcota bacterium]|nr:haloacid dehalogenase-like hydrolase [Myxococcota bacterium]MBU1380158.1 haloacid dehalogenase-like hydrolase [Myxococcota bacterium]MBU1498678.1 haloacid dehalogenase-like hydrolase [Myxococcota bacterium]
MNKKAGHTDSTGLLNLVKQIKSFDSDNLRDMRFVAVWDWDNTVIDGDVGDLVFNHLTSGHVKLANMSWYRDVHFLSQSVKHALSGFESNCNKDDCFEYNNFLRRIYYTFKDPQGEKAFVNYDENYFNPSYAMVGLMLDGYNREDLRKLLQSYFKKITTNDFNAVSKINGVIVPDRIRIRAVFRYFSEQLKSRNIPIIVLTASPQFVIEELTAFFNISVDRILGIPYSLENNTIKSNQKMFLQVNGMPVVNYKMGKIKCLEKYLPAGYQIVFSAGDSDSDLAFMKATLGPKISIISNEKLYSVHEEAQNNKSGDWFVWKPGINDIKKESLNPN